jgi:dTDP-glucose 4,6-dehydratase
MKSVLITGGAGFIGSNFIHHLQSSDKQVKIINFDALTYAGNPDNLMDLPDDKRHTLIHGDIVDQELVEALLREHKIDSIIHFAAESHVDRSIHGPAPFVRTNILGTFSLLEAARKVWLEEKLLSRESVRFHHVSTDEVYGSLEPDDPAFTEMTPYAPNSPYAASKAASDHLVRAYAHTYGLPVTLSNCSNNYGPYQFPEKLIPLMILNAFEGKPLPIYGDGQQIRDWLHVEDHCKAIMTILASGRPGETYNIGGGNQPTNLELVEQLCSILDERLPDSPHRPHASLIQFVPDRPGHDRRYAMDFRKIQSELGWLPSESLESGLLKTVDWYFEHTDWLNNIHNRPSLQNWMTTNYAHRELGE